MHVKHINKSQWYYNRCSIKIWIFWKTWASSNKEGNYKASSCFGLWLNQKVFTFILLSRNVVSLKGEFIRYRFDAILNKTQIRHQTKTLRTIELKCTKYL